MTRKPEHLEEKQVADPGHGAAVDPDPRTTSARLDALKGGDREMESNRGEGSPNAAQSGGSRTRRSAVGGGRARGAVGGVSGKCFW